MKWFWTRTQGPGLLRVAESFDASASEQVISLHGVDTLVSRQILEGLREHLAAAEVATAPDVACCSGTANPSIYIVI